MAITVTCRSAESDELFPGLEQMAGRDQEWLNHETEGQLAVDVFESPQAITLRTAIAGVRPQDLEVTIQNDLLTVRGHRTPRALPDESRFIVSECHWGGFSRSIILPAEVDTEGITAELRDGVLTVSLPKLIRSRRIAVSIPDKRHEH